jgi:hypothetical protein
VIQLATQGPLSIFLFTRSSFIALVMEGGGGTGQFVLEIMSRHSGHL